MKHILLQSDMFMGTLELSHNTNHLRFYLSSCESGTGIDISNSNICSRHPSLPSSSLSSSSISSLNVGISTNASSTHTNQFLNILKHPCYLIHRRQKHGHYRTRLSSLNNFFKKTQLQSINQFYKSSSYPQLAMTIHDKRDSILRSNKSDYQLHIINANKSQLFDIENDCFTIQKPSLQYRRTLDKTVSEDNNTNTMSSFDLPIALPTFYITDSTSSVTDVQMYKYIDINIVSDFFSR